MTANTTVKSIVQIGIDAFDESFEAALAARPDEVWKVGGKATKALPNKEDADFWRSESKVWINKYFKWRMANPHLQVWTLPTGQPAIEVDFSVKVPNSDVVCKGYIDRIFIDTRSERLLIVDLKSGKTAQPSPLQLGFYRLGILQLFGIDIRYGSFYDARAGALDAEYDLDQFPPEMISRWLRNADKAIRLNLLTPNVSRDCSWCSVKDHCYVWNPGIPRPDFNSDVPLTFRSFDNNVEA